jgi:tetratricopeptide (TPR) repeat protein
MFRIAITFIASALLTLLSAAYSSGALAADREICDIPADSALGQEDYATAATLHRRFLSVHPNDALAHYHLGFAYGMMGHRADEITEYLAAERLGLNKWDLFLNLGRAFLEQNQLPNAVGALETAISLDPKHAEAHYNLALVYERQSRLAEALEEITASRRLAPEDLDAANTNGIICAEMGNLSCARDVWTHTLEVAPDYSPARTNLVMLKQSEERPKASIVAFPDVNQSGG